jgi:TetR/AcrR family transcriptional regulator, transcriptional repressor for nem operon
MMRDTKSPAAGRLYPTSSAEANRYPDGNASACPHGSLCLELDKRADGPGLAAELMRTPIKWMRRQFESMGRPDACDLAVHLLARYQGAALLTSTLRDPDLMAREAARAAQWIDALD